MSNIHTAQSIADELRQKIESGNLKPGDQLVSVRKYAALIGVNKNTVASAYQKLQGMGIIEPDGRSKRVALRDFSVPQSLEENEFHDLHDLSFGNPDPKLLPAYAEVLVNAVKVSPQLYNVIPDDPLLVDVVKDMAKAELLPEGDVMIVSGTTVGMQEILSAFLEPGDQVLVEDPGYMKLLHLLRFMNLKPVPIPMTPTGMDTDVLEKTINKKCKAIVITPRAQNPTGITYTPERLKQIRKLLDVNPQILIIEDEHLGLLGETPYLSLCSTEDKNWAIFRSFSKYLGPDLRTGAVIGSSTVIQRMKSRRAASGQWVSRILQTIVYQLLTSPKVLASITEARAIYVQRRKLFLQKIRKSHLEITGTEGLNVWLPMDNAEDVAASLLEKGWVVRTGRDFCLLTKNGLRITTALVATDEIETIASAVIEAYETTVRNC